MSENRILGWWLGGMVCIAVCLVVGVNCWEDHPDVANIGHLFDFHCDVDRIAEEYEADRDRLAYEKEQRRIDDASWAHDLHHIVGNQQHCRDCVQDRRDAFDNANAQGGSNWDNTPSENSRDAR